MVTAGVYKYVRPRFGFGLLFFSRVEREEQAMIETFGEDYRAYMPRTSRVVWFY